METPTESLIAGYRVLAGTLDTILSELEKEIRPGITTRRLEDRAVQLMNKAGVRSYFKGYNDFPAHITTSINQEVINTIPSTRILRAGDLLSIQIGITDGVAFSYQGWTYLVGPGKDTDRNLIQATGKALREACALCTTEHTMRDISHAIQTGIETAGFSVNRSFVGHGMGTKPHQPPEVPGFVLPTVQATKRLLSNQILSIVAIAHAGKPDSRVTDDGWNVVTQDGSNAVHFSNIVIVRKTTPELLTRERALPV